MLFHRHGFYVRCKAKDLKRQLLTLGAPERKIKDILNLHLH